MERTGHVLDRISERLEKGEVAKIETMTMEACRECGTRSVAVIAHKLEAQRGEVWGEKSNGNCVVVIVRDNKVITAFLRRASQSWDLGMTRTDVLIDMTGSVLPQRIIR